MLKALLFVLVVILAISPCVSAAEIRFNDAVFNQTDCSVIDCAFEWNDKNSWIGGRIPVRNDDVVIGDFSNQIEIHCPYYCEARSISGNNLFVNMTKMNALVNVTTINANSLSMANGVLKSSNINVNGTVEFDNVVTVGVPSLSVTSQEFRLTDSVVDLLALNANISSLESSQLQIDQQLVVAYRWTVLNSTLRIYGTCQCPNGVQPSTADNSIVNSEVHVRASCNFCLNDQMLIRQSSWNIESVKVGNDTETYEVTDVKFVFSDATLAVADNVELLVNDTLTLNDGVVQSSHVISIGEFGTIQGCGRIHSSLTAGKSAHLATSHGDLTIEGLVTLNEGSTLQIENGTFYLTTLRIFNNTKLSIVEGSTTTELVIATDLIAGSFSDLNFYDESVELVYNYTHIYIRQGVNNAPQSSEEPSAPSDEAPQAQQQPPHVAGPVSSVNPPSGEESSTDGKVVVIVILSILLGMMTIAVAALVFKMRQLQAGYMPLSSKILPFSDDDI